MKPLFISFVILFALSSNLFAIPPQKTTHPDDDHPIQIESDSADFDNAAGTAIHRGHVKVMQGTRQLTADTLMIHRTKEGKIDKITAYGNPAYFEAIPNPEKPKVMGNAKIIHYFLEGKKVILEKNAELSQNDSTLQGASIIYYIDTGIMTANSSSEQKTTVILNTGT